MAENDNNRYECHTFSFTGHSRATDLDCPVNQGVIGIR